MQHDVLAFPNLQNAIESLQNLVDQGLLLFAKRLFRLDNDGLALEQDFEFRQSIGPQRAACRHDVADVVGTPQPGCNLDGTGKVDGFGVDVVFP